MIHEGLDSKDFETRHAAKIFADSLRRTTRILRVEKTSHLKDDGKRYLKQLVFMTKYLMQNTGLPIEQRMRRIQPKLKELERHQTHQLFLLQHLKNARKTESTRKRKAKVRLGKKPKRGKKAKKH